MSLTITIFFAIGVAVVVLGVTIRIFLQTNGHC